LVDCHYLFYSGVILLLFGQRQHYFSLNNSNLVPIETFGHNDSQLFVLHLMHAVDGSKTLDFMAQFPNIVVENDQKDLVAESDDAD